MQPVQTKTTEISQTSRAVVASEDILILNTFNGRGIAAEHIGSQHLSTTQNFTTVTDTIERTIVNTRSFTDTPGNSGRSFTAFGLDGGDRNTSAIFNPRNSQPTKAKNPDIFGIAPQPNALDNLISPILANTAIGVLKDLFFESPAAKAERELAEKKAAEAQLQSLKQTASAEISQLEAMSAGKHIESQIGALKGKIDNGSIAAIESAIDTANSIEASANATLETSTPIAQTEKLANPSITITAGAIQKLEGIYLAQGPEGKFQSLILEALTSIRPSAQATSAFLTIETSYPKMLESVKNDLEQAAIQTSYSQYTITEGAVLPQQIELIADLNQNTEALNYNQDSLTSTDSATPFSRYANSAIAQEIAPNAISDLSGFSFSIDLRGIGFSKSDAHESLAA